MLLLVVFLQFQVVLLQSSQFLVNVVLLPLEVILVALDLILLELELHDAGVQVVETVLGEQDAGVQFVRDHVRPPGWVQVLDLVQVQHDGHVDLVQLLKLHSLVVFQLVLGIL